MTPMDWGLQGSSIHGILQVRILEWVAISFSNSLYANLKKKKSKWTYLQNKNKLTNLENRFMVTREKGGGIDWEVGIDMYTLLFLKQITRELPWQPSG